MAQTSTTVQRGVWRIHPISLWIVPPSGPARQATRPRWQMRAAATPAKARRCPRRTCAVSLRPPGEEAPKGGREGFRSLFGHVVPGVDAVAACVRCPLPPDLHRVAVQVLEVVPE